MKRGGKIVVVAHCFLNQNSRVRPTALRPGAFKELIMPLVERDFGIIQLPCPETTCFGLDRWDAVVEQFDTAHYRRHCRNLVEPYIDQLQEHRRIGHKIFACLGVALSPSCATQFHPTSKDWGGAVVKQEIKRPKKGEGPAIFMQEFMLLCRDIDLDMTFMDVSEVEGWLPDNQPQKVLELLLKEVG